jgi:hypothetical protein
MNSRKKLVLGVGLLAMVLMGVFPPWVVSYSHPTGSVAYSVGYSFVLSPPFSGL